MASISYRKLKRHYRHIGNGQWLVKGWLPQTHTCDVCGAKFKSFKLYYPAVGKNLKRIPNYTRMGMLCSYECMLVRDINPLVYEHR
jgi:hypothetical protein